ncbi:hypothetical protein N8T08_006821 [Aspergillus melleus]|uniref:Uncharacterized protein n=1 Tax=Aspergillus melleus TaxID=138277 RepID=A0ACC3AZ75_9EURO|nr:hypothetical protein N8T08_006821 [Aspergillus melleus]
MATDAKLVTPEAAALPMDWEENVKDLTAALREVNHLVRLQTQTGGSALSAARNIWKKEGRSAFYKVCKSPKTVTLLREFHGYGAWFATYEGLLEILQGRTQMKRHELLNWQIAVCGGLAGEALWPLSHPLDVIKSKMQSDGPSKSTAT